ncbi:flagellar brake protein [Solibacillus silvestris]|uniref:flagellar brake protein n=1 Tax=Solibacillus silvestris TaxID=76853 RepID=UPI003F809E2E
MVELALRSLLRICIDCYVLMKWVKHLMQKGDEGLPDTVSATEFFGGQLFELLTADNELFFTHLIKHESNLLVQRPLNRKGLPLVIENRMPITVYFHDMEGLYSFESNIQQFPDSRILIDTPSENSIKKAQRRQFFRIHVAVKMNIILPASNNPKQLETVEVTSHDIGADGASFLFPEKIGEPENLINGSLHIEVNNIQKNVEFRSRIVSVIEQGKQSYRISFQFVEMNDSARSIITKFCILKQIELRNKIRDSG